VGSIVCKRLFGDHNRDLLWPPGVGKVIVLSDSNKEKEVHEETTAKTGAAPSATMMSLTPATPAADEDPGKM
jgi:hypothetical protein